MFITGHAASALLAARRWDLDLKMILIANQFPDVVDKSAKHVLGLVPYGRLPAHTLLVLALTTAVVFLLDRRMRKANRWVIAWVAGYGLHLAGDFADMVPLLWPFRAYDLPQYGIGDARPVSPALLATFVLDMGLFVLAIGVEARRWLKRRRARPSTASRYSPAGPEPPRP